MGMGEIILRLVIAIFVGGAIGYERSTKNKSAGFRTHALVCIGAAIIAIIQVNMSYEALDMIHSNPAYAHAFTADRGRLVAQVVSGIGFLGAGTIMQQKGSVRGLTTAATLWVVGCLGIAVGLGYYFLSIVAAVGVIIILYGLQVIEEKFIFKQTKVVVISITYTDMETLSTVEKMLKAIGAYIYSTEFEGAKEGESSENHCVFKISVPRRWSDVKFVHNISKINGMVKVEVRG